MTAGGGAALAAVVVGAATEEVLSATIAMTIAKTTARAIAAASAGSRPVLSWRGAVWVEAVMFEVLLEVVRRPAPRPAIRGEAGLLVARPRGDVRRVDRRGLAGLERSDGRPALVVERAGVRHHA